MKKEDYTENEMKPKGYKLNEARKKEMLSNIQQSDKRKRQKKKRAFPLKPTLGLGVAALILFILFANPILSSLRQDTEAGLTNQINFDPDQTLVKLLDKESIQVDLLNEVFEPHKNAKRVTGLVSFSIPHSSQVIGNKSSFRIRVWNDHTSAMSKDYPSENVFSKDTNSSLFAFEIPLTKEEALNLKKQNVTLGLYISPDWDGELKNNPATYKELKTDIELETIRKELGDVPPAIQRVEIVQRAEDGSDIPIDLLYDYYPIDSIKDKNQLEDLVDLYTSIKQKQDEGDITPYIYLNKFQNEGCIIEAKKNFEILIHELEFDSQNSDWSISDTTSVLQ